MAGWALRRNARGDGMALILQGVAQDVHGSVSRASLHTPRGVSSPRGISSPWHFMLEGQENKNYSGMFI